MTLAIPATPPLSIVLMLAIACLVLAAAVTVLVLRERRRDVCGDQRPHFGELHGLTAHCELPHGHRSPWHRGEDGSEWKEQDL